jgi:hypothetical protein
MGFVFSSEFPHHRNGAISHLAVGQLIQKIRSHLDRYARDDDSSTVPPSASRPYTPATGLSEYSQRSNYTTPSPGVVEAAPTHFSTGLRSVPLAGAAFAAPAAQRPTAASVVAAAAAVAAVAAAPPSMHMGSAGDQSDLGYLADLRMTPPSTPSRAALPFSPGIWGPGAGAGEGSSALPELLAGAPGGSPQATPSAFSAPARSVLGLLSPGATDTSPATIGNFPTPTASLVSPAKRVHVAAGEMAPVTPQRL